MTWIKPLSKNLEVEGQVRMLFSRKLRLVASKETLRRRFWLVPFYFSGWLLLVQHPFSLQRE